MQGSIIVFEPAESLGDVGRVVGAEVELEVEGLVSVEIPFKHLLLVQKQRHLRDLIFDFFGQVVVDRLQAEPIVLPSLFFPFVDEVENSILTVFLILCQLTIFPFPLQEFLVHFFHFCKLLPRLIFCPFLQVLDFLPAREHFLFFRVHLLLVLIDYELLDGHEVKLRTVNHRMLVFTLAMWAFEDLKLALIGLVLVLQRFVVLVVVGVVLDHLLKSLDVQVVDCGIFTRLDVEGQDFVHQKVQA